MLYFTAAASCAKIAARGGAIAAAASAARASDGNARKAQTQYHTHTPKRHRRDDHRRQRRQTNTMADDEPMEEAPADAPAEGEVEVAEMSVLDALRDVLKRALIHGGLKRGLREVAKALDSRTAKLCCLAKDCDNAEYSNLVRALCDEGGVSLVMVDEGKQLGEWAGLCKINEEGEATSVVRCSAACVTEFGEDTRALSVLLTYLKAQAPEDK
jgi:small subunit ribosomal protein S12e